MLLRAVCCGQEELEVDRAETDIPFYMPTTVASLTVASGRHTLI